MTAGEVEPLDPGGGRVDVWWCTTGEPVSPVLLSRCRDLLSSEERAEHAELPVESRRHEYLVTRAMARAVLSFYADVAPSGWRFAPTQHGRPEVVGPDGAPRLRFSLSNTAGLVACGVTAGQDLGIDAEDTSRSVDFLALAERFFSPAEARELRELAPERRRGRFFEYWTLKEAYVKARGRGLAIPLEQFSFRVAENGEARIACDAGFDDERAWQFRLLRVLDRFTLAVGVRREARPDVEIRVSRFAPGATGGPR
jgi:4'-phosphopantetheinyl transferase